MPVPGWQTTACDDNVNSKALHFFPLMYKKRTVAELQQVHQHAHRRT